jgi:ectoine hydroxylase-related dioxygenase (phytanoyl-CoA dioxygenase family)
VYASELIKGRRRGHEQVILLKIGELFGIFFLNVQFRLQQKCFHMNEQNLPSLDSTMHLPADLVQQFRDNGHALTKSVLNQDELVVYRHVINEAAYKFNTEKRNMEERDTYGKAFLQIMNLWEVDENVKKFTMAKRFAAIAANLLGVPNVRIYHDQALYKEPGGGFTPWHQDQYYWPLNTTQTVTMWMPLVDVTVDMGMLTFASGSHREGAVGNIAISDESESELNEHIRKKGFPVARPSLMKAGDASWHYGWTLHSAPGNKSSITREVMTIIYFADGARVTRPINEHQEADRQRWLCGLEPTSLADSDLNPLV